MSGTNVDNRTILVIESESLHRDKPTIHDTLEMNVLQKPDLKQRNLQKHKHEKYRYTKNTDTSQYKRKKYESIQTHLKKFFCRIKSFIGSLVQFCV